MDESDDTSIYPGWGISKLSTELSYFLDILRITLLLKCINILLRGAGSIEQISRERVFTIKYCTLPLCLVKLSSA